MEPLQAPPLEESPFLDPIALKHALGPYATRFQIIQVDTLDSTQNALRRHIPSLSSPTCLVARHQLAGRGRQGKVWHSHAEHSLTFSLWWVFDCLPHELTTLNLLVSLAVAYALEQAGISGIQLKWPNDLLRQGGKVGGIIAELFPMPNHHSGAIIGIGLNLYASALQMQVDRPIADLTTNHGIPQRATLLGLILAQLATLLQKNPRWHGELEAAWLARCSHYHQPVTLQLPDQSQVLGRCIGLAPSGGVRVAHNDGRIVTYHGGDISLLQETA